MLRLPPRSRRPRSFICRSPRSVKCASVFNALGNSRRAVEQWERFSRDVVLLLPDDATATAYAELKQSLALKGKPIPENDLWIAATAKSHGLPLYCQDAHFNELAGLMSIIQA